MGTPLPSNFMGIGIILGLFYNIRAKGPTETRGSITHMTIKTSQMIKGTRNKQKWVSKRKRHLLKRRSEIFLKLTEDTLFREAMDSEEKSTSGTCEVKAL